MCIYALLQHIVLILQQRLTFSFFIVEVTISFIDIFYVSTITPLILLTIGTLNFLNLYSAMSLTREDDTYASVPTYGGFEFGSRTIFTVYVRA